MFSRCDDYDDGEDDAIIFHAERTLTIGWKRHSICPFKHEFQK